MISSQDWTAPEAASQKIPQFWGEAQPNKKKPGWRWRDPTNQGNGVRIDRGNADSNFPSQQVDHVIVRKDGQIIGRNGQLITGSIKNNPTEAHIPLDEWLRKRGTHLNTGESGMVQYPKMREDLLEIIRSLTEREYQHKAWLHRDYPPGIEYDSFDEAVHFLYDDTLLAENPTAAIRVILENEKEAGLMAAVCQAIDLVFEVLGTEASEEEYIKSSEWTSVVEAASRALQVMENQSQKAVKV